MGTKTKPVKEWQASFVHDVRLDDDRRSRVTNLLDIDETAADPVIAEIEQVLKFGTARVHARATEPLPANLLAELGPVAKLARELADAINQLSPTARVMPGVNVAGALWHAAVEFHSSARIVCDELDRQGRKYQEARKSGSTDAMPHGSDGGSRKANVRAAREGVRDVLAAIYDNTATQPTAKGRKDFLKLVTGKA